MGGHALPEGSTERKERVDYERIKNEVLLALQRSTVHGIYITPIPEMPEKTSFGDLDLLYYCISSTEGEEVDMCEIVKRELHPHHMVVHGEIISFDYGRCQVDLILINEGTIERSNLFC